MPRRELDLRGCRTRSRRNKPSISQALRGPIRPFGIVIGWQTARFHTIVMPEIEVPVLIVGGSLVGLSTALLLGHHGVGALAVEHHHGTAIYPRAAQMYQRTMEILRSV